jgi:hypothetical protein
VQARNESERDPNRSAILFTPPAPSEGDAPRKMRKDHVRAAAVREVMKRLAGGERVVVVASTLSFTEQLAKIAEARFGASRSVAVYNADRERVSLAIVDEEWQKLDLLIYSPSISAGVSFLPRASPECAPHAHFDSLVAYFANAQKCPPVVTCMQMLWRVRMLKTGEMRLFVDDERAVSASHLTTMGQVHAAMSNDLRKDLSEFSASPLNVSAVDRHINLKLRYDPERVSFHVVAGVIATENRSAAMFVEILQTALEEEYGVPTKCEAVVPPDRDTVEEVHGAAAAVKAEAGVPWGRIRVLFEEREAREIRRPPDPSPEDRASLRLFTYAAKMWNVQLHLVNERFYRELVEADDAREK